MGFANQYIAKAQEGLRYYLLQPLGKETLHQVRVLIKKMQALWLIHPLGEDLPFNRNFPHQRRLFKMAAVTRDKQMVRICLHALPAFLKHIDLDKILRKDIRKSKDNLRKTLKLQKFKHGLADDMYRFRAYYKMAARYLVEQNRKTFRDQLFLTLKNFKYNNEEALHALRRHIKSFIYQEEAFQVDHRKVTGPSARTESLTNLQHHLGIWHDWWNSLQWMKEIDSMDLHPKPKSLLEQTIRKETALKRDVLRELRLLAANRVHA
jgi:CHAD domain-containing protein